MQGFQILVARSIGAVCLGGASIVSDASGIDVPDGHLLKHSFSAEGVQIYECDASISK